MLLDKTSVFMNHSASHILHNILILPHELWLSPLTRRKGFGFIYSYFIYT